VVADVDVDAVLVLDVVVEVEAVVVELVEDESMVKAILTVLTPSLAETA
jgi:hypothetical protein